MKHGIVALFALVLLLIVALAPTNATTTWITTRDDISISAITVDISNYTNRTMSTTSTTVNVTLPCLVSALNGSVSYINISSTVNISYNLSINGHTFNTSSVLNVTYNNRNLTNVTTTQSTISNHTYLNVTYQSNTTDGNITIYIYADDATCTATFTTNAQTVREKDVKTPEVENAKGKSYFTVNDSINITHTVGYNLTDVNLSLTYPSHRISEPYAYLNVGTITNNSYALRYVNYQKRGPYVKAVEDESEGTSHEVNIYVECEEVLQNAVIYEITTSDDVYEGYLDTLNYDTLTVKYNDAEVSWEEGSVYMEDQTLKSGWRGNKFTLTWTEEAPTPVEPEVPIWETTFLWLQLWIWMIIAVIIIVIIIAVLIAKD